MRLVVCSNSAPLHHPGAGLSPRSPGGLVPLLISLLEETGGEWFFTDPGRGEYEGPVRSAERTVLQPVTVPTDVAEQHYLDIGVRLFLWLFHYLLDTAREPVFDAAFAAAWRSYEQVNEAYAERLGADPGHADDVLLVNDYHLFLLPEMLAARGARRRGRLVYVHGLPWCEPQYYACLPDGVGDRILASLLRCDVVAFHDSRWAAAFRQCCARFLPRCTDDGSGVTYRGHRTRVVVTTFPLDTATLDEMAADPRASGWGERLDGLAGGRRVLARADRLDLWKNHPRGFAAYASLLADDPGLAREWWFCAVTTLPRLGTERSRAHHEHCEQVVREINDRYGSAERPAVSLVRPDSDSTRHCVVAALSRADAVLVNPTIDGMNLVAKEALYLAPRAPVLLSVNAGAHEHLAPHVTALQPFDVTATAAALRTAMTPAARSTRPDLADLLRGSGPVGWLRALTTDVGADTGTGIAAGEETTCTPTG